MPSVQIDPSAQVSAPVPPCPVRGSRVPRSPALRSPDAKTALDRRSVLRGTAYGAALFAAGGVIPALTACGAAGKSAEQKTAEELVPFAQSALADADDAQSLIATNPDRTAALTVIADERRIHARLLEEEIARLHPDDYSASPSPSAPTGSPAQPDIDSFRTRLSTQARMTADLAVTQNGYVAGLLGSISVALDCAAKVQLP